MDARIVRAALVAVVALMSMGASYRTQNFVVTAPTAPIARQVGDSAERFRRELAIEWLGAPMNPWSQPCPINVQVGERLGAGGATSFIFDRGEVFGWQMSIQGSLERVLDSVLPHEVTHTIFATHFRRPLPRWADEGACTTVEHPSERNKQQQMLIQFLKTGRGIPFSAMFAMKEYPADVLPLYAQGHSLAGFLIGRGGKRKFLQFVRDGLENEDWTAVLSAHYGYADLRVLQNTWLDWVAKGSPLQALPTVDAEAVAASGTNRPAAVLSTGPISAPMQATNVVAAAPPQASPPPLLADDLGRWVAAEHSNRKRPRPQPNLVHQEAAAAKTIPSDAAVQVAATNETRNPAGTIGAGHLVPVELAAPSTAASPVAASPAASVPSPADPFVAVAAASATSSAGATHRSGASRPQLPQTPGQIVLEWTKAPEATLPMTAPAYSSGIATGTPQTPVFDAATGGTLRR